ncbi:MAG: phage capsid protein [Candidatus Omnitrophota bacterium]|jgi:hypothetical protein
MGDISTLFVKQFSSNITILSQQKGSKLRDKVLFRGGIVGEDWFIDQVAKITAKTKTTRNSDIEYSDPDRQRRKLSPVTLYASVLLDKEDKVKMLVDPTSADAQNIAYAIGRGLDDLIVTAAFGTAYYGKDGSSSESFDTTNNVVAVGAAGLTVEKLLNAKEILDNYDVDEEEPRFCAVTGTQLKNLLRTTEATSADYNTVKALVKGEINTFCGFNFVKLSKDILDTDTDGYRRVIAWAKNGLALGMSRDMNNRIDEIPGKHYATQVYSAADAGATRADMDKVVEIKCSE